MKRWIWRFVWRTSLLIAIGTAVLWVRSYWIYDACTDWQMGEQASTHWYLLGVSAEGHVAIKLSVFDQKISPAIRFNPKSRHTASYVVGTRDARDLLWGSASFDDRTMTDLNFAFGHSNDWPPFGAVREYGIRVPHWGVVITCLIAPMVALIAALRRRVRTSNVGQCSNCGYDLRATPERCPECGAVPKNLAAKM